MTPATAIILAGGKSTRMGRNKALIRVKDDNMLQEAIRTLAGGFNELIVSANDSSYDSLKIKTVPDIFPGCGPLAGIHAGLRASGHDINFIVACDMPFIDVKLALYMVELSTGFDAVVPKIGEYYEPLFAVYNKSCLPVIEAQLQRGRNKTSGFFPEVKVRYIDQNDLERFGHSNCLFFNVNTPSDLQKAQEMLGRRDDGSKI